MSFIIKSRIWIDKNDAPFLGSGRIELLETIHKKGSISKAASHLNMSYKKAWTLIKSMNTQANSPLVEKEIGGKNGGGSRLTPTGKSIIKTFRKLEKKNKKYLEKELMKCCFENDIRN